MLESFVKRVEAEKLPVRAVAVMQGGKLRERHDWEQDLPHNIFSHTKSFMATAVGLALADGLLRLTDKPAEFFPEALPTQPDEGLFRITLRDLLMMSSGFDQPFLMMPGRYEGEDAPDYARAVFAHSLRAMPGSRFCYSNGDSYLAGRMVEKVTGKTLRDYLNERVFQPLEIAYPDWELCPMRHTFGASGLRLRLADMMKLGQLYLNNGKWADTQIVDPQWVREATAKQIDTPRASETEIWTCGYGYQFWRCPYPEAYRADGAHVQVSLVLPEKDMVVGIQCRNNDVGHLIIRAIDEEIVRKE